MSGEAELGLRTPLEGVTFAILDTETTGLSPQSGGRVCELAILPVRDGRPQKLFQELIDPEGPIDPGAQAVHGITAAMLAGKPTFRELARRVQDLLAGTVLVCHNAPFDMGFMQAEFRRAGLPMPPVPVVDTLSLARRHFRFASNRLGSIASALGVEARGWHRAGSDVQILAGVFARFLKDLRKDKGVETVEALLAL